VEVAVPVAVCVAVEVRVAVADSVGVGATDGVSVSSSVWRRLEQPVIVVSPVNVES